MPENSTGKPAIYFKARQRIVEEVAIRQVADNIVDCEEGIPLPQDWLQDIDQLRERIMDLIRQAVASDPSRR